MLALVGLLALGCNGHTATPDPLEQPEPPPSPPSLELLVAEHDRVRDPKHWALFSTQHAPSGYVDITREADSFDVGDYDQVRAYYYAFDAWHWDARGVDDEVSGCHAGPVAADGTLCPSVVLPGVDVGVERGRALAALFDAPRHGPPREVTCLLRPQLAFVYTRAGVPVGRISIDVDCPKWSAAPGFEEAFQSNAIRDAVVGLCKEAGLFLCDLHDAEQRKAWERWTAERVEPLTFAGPDSRQRPRPLPVSRDKTLAELDDRERRRLCAWNLQHIGVRLAPGRDPSGILVEGVGELAGRALTSTECVERFPRCSRTVGEVAPCMDTAQRGDIWFVSPRARPVQGDARLRLGVRSHGGAAMTRAQRRRCVTHVHARCSSGMRWMLAVLFAAVLLVPVAARAALPPEVYEQLRQSAPVVVVGVVQSDPGGQAFLRVEVAERGGFAPGQVVTVVYPEDHGVNPVGGDVYYRRFYPGTRLRVFGQPAGPQALRIVEGGIDTLGSGATQPRRGGCASCTIGTSSSSWSSAAPLAILFAMLFWRRRSALAVVAVAAACAPAAQPVRDGEHEVASDGSSTLVVQGPEPTASGPAVPVPAGPPTDESCRQAPACAERGACHATAGGCAPTSFADCQQIAACAHGRCAFEGGACKTLASCQGSEGCTGEGLCADAEAGCSASAEGCLAAKVCATEGRCTAAEGLCVAASDAECKKSEACAQGGRCKAEQGSCKVQSDLQCKKTPVCQAQGACVARDGMCVKSCAESELCKRFGRCGERASHAGSCVAVEEAHCKASALCKDQGLCSVSLTARCEAGDDVECRLARACGEEGLCTATKGKCLPASDAECAAATIACKRDGRCKHDAGRCVKG